MTFIDLNLRATDKAAMDAALEEAGFVRSEVMAPWHHPDATLLLLPPGMVTRPTGEVQVVDGVEVAVREPVPGYHANVRTTSEELAEQLAPVTVVVESPQYVWA
ncbi:hypothetical protein [Aeromonas caviae]|uniref:hypothetical protein n=1 Tax=Aeromonas caviae TaxID=648 RepID=UPI0038D259EE